MLCVLLCVFLQSEHVLWQSCRNETLFFSPGNGSFLEQRQSSRTCWTFCGDAALTYLCSALLRCVWWTVGRWHFLQEVKHNLIMIFTSCLVVSPHHHTLRHEGAEDSDCCHGNKIDSGKLRRKKLASVIYGDWLIYLSNKISWKLMTFHQTAEYFQLNSLISAKLNINTHRLHIHMKRSQFNILNMCYSFRTFQTGK